MRSFLLYAGVFLAAGTLVRGEPTVESELYTELSSPGFEVDYSRTDLNRPARQKKSLYEGSIVDAHVHLHPPKNGIDVSALAGVIDALEDAGVEFAVFMPTPNEGRNKNHEKGADQRKMLLAKNKDRVRLFAGANYIDYPIHRANQGGYSHADFEKILVRLSADLKDTEYLGFGELVLFHFEKRKGQHVLMVPPGFKPLLEVVSLIAENDVWIDLHAEPVDPGGVSYEDDVFGGIELLHRRNPGLKLILAHTAMTNPHNAMSLLNTYPKVMMSIKIRKNHEKWKNLEPIVNSEGEIYEDWAQLFEEMPERFIIGTDAKFERKDFKAADYLKKIKDIRYLLGSIDPDAARLIAYENAFGMFR